MSAPVSGQVSLIVRCGATLLGQREDDHAHADHSCIPGHPDDVGSW